MDVLWSATGPAIARLLERPTKDVEVLGDEGVHDDNEDERDDQRDDGIDQVDNVHEFVVVGEEVADGFAVHAFGDPGREEGIRVHGQGDESQNGDDDLCSTDRAHERSLQGVLDGNKPLDGKSHRQPDGQAGTDGTAVDHGLAKSRPVEQIDVKVVQPDDEKS